MRNDLVYNRQMQVLFHLPLYPLIQQTNLLAYLLLFPEPANNQLRIIFNIYPNNKSNYHNRFMRSLYYGFLLYAFSYLLDLLAILF
jgi:hypothetical protein